MKLIASIFILLFTIQLQAQNWQPISSVPSAGRDDGLAFSIGEFGYVVTGNQGGFTESNKLFQYNPTTNSWTEKAFFPGTARQYSSVFVINNKAYMIGGYSEAGVPLNDVWSYDAFVDSWTQLNDFPSLPRWHATATSIQETGYFGMGSCLDSTLSDFWKYNPELDSWTKLKNYPGGGLRSVLGLPILNSIVCGEGFSINPINYSSSWFKFDSETEEWTSFTPFPGGLRSYGTAISNGLTAMVCGGMDENSVFKNDCYQLDYAGEWNTLPMLPPTGLRGAKGFYLNGKFYLGTGLDNNFQRISDFYTFQPEVGDDIFTTIFPNPSNSNFVMIGEAYANVTIYRLNGQLIGTYTIQESGYLEVNNLPNGLYLALIEGETTSEIVKLARY